MSAEVSGSTAPSSPDQLAQHLLRLIAPQLDGRDAPFVLGISGLQGSGKSTLARHLVEQMPAGQAVAVSLDDVYLDRNQRAALAHQIHPLFATRGVPGTHAVALLETTLTALAHASPERPVPLPRFDKGHDEPAAKVDWPVITVPPRLVVLEGWCLGLPPESDDALRQPLNALERDEDPHGLWRGHVNAQLAGTYVRLWQRIDHLLLLQAPAFAVVEAWRDQAERELRRQGAPQAMDTRTLKRFIVHYERLSRHALTVLPILADTVVALDAERKVLSIHGRNTLHGISGA